MRLRVELLSYAYRAGNWVLNGVSLESRAGEVLFLLGPNGSGKTTLVECLAGLRRPQAGRATVDGQDIHGLPHRLRARLIAYVPQLHRPVFGYRVLDVVTMGRAPYLGLASRPGRDDVRTALAALESVGLGGVDHRPYSELSGGELRLVLIARALAQGAQFILLDEPDAHLDPGNQHRVLELAGRLAGTGRGLVITSHNPNAALAYGDRVALLKGGRVAGQGHPQGVLTPEVLQRAYGLRFVLLRGETGELALVPAQGRSPESSSTESASGTGSRHSSISCESKRAIVNGA